MLRVFGFSEKIKVIYPGVYMPQRFEEELGLSSQSKLVANCILFAGRLAPYKGADIFIEAFSELLQKNRSLKAVVIGDGSEKKNLVALVKKLGVQKSITFLPACSREELFE